MYVNQIRWWYQDLPLQRHHPRPGQDISGIHEPFREEGAGDREVHEG
jgi:hypothetical protein